MIERKSHNKKYMFYRICCIGAVPILALFWLYGMSLFRVVFGAYVVFICYVVINVMIFPFNYGILGAQKRKNGDFLGELIDSSSVAGPRQLPIFTYSLYTGGIEVSVLCIGTAIVCFDEIDTISRASKFGFGCLLYHHSNEIRSPLRITDSKFCKALANYFDEKKLEES